VRDFGSHGTVQGVRFHGPNDIRLGSVDLDAPQPTEVRVRPVAVGICGTDAKIVEGTFAAERGVVIGHEIAGYVDAVGSAVASVREGDLVAIEPHLYCGTCRYCQRGLEHLCIAKRAFGVHLDGGMAGALTVPARLAYPVDPSIDPVIACLAEPLGCAIHGMDRLEPASGLPVLVVGAGPAGLMLTSLARLAGLTPIVVIEPDAMRRSVATAMGADVTIDPAAEGWREMAREVTGGDGFDYLIEASGRPEGTADALELTARAARVLIYGVARPGETTIVEPQQIYAKELTILGTALNPFSHGRAVRLLQDARLDLLRPTTYPLAAFADAFHAQHHRSHLKVVLNPQD
jgi:2-desacetyl-2-hydroxyethyl bacteriochlorophyllide A dehydrogenase